MTMKPIRAAFPLGFLFLLAVLTVGGCSGPRADHAESADPGAAEAQPGAEGSQAPDFALADLDGDTVHLSDSAGQVRLVDFWATWCAPCREEIPMLKDLHREFEGQRLTILAISDERADVVRPFAEDHEIPYPNLVEGAKTFEEYGALGLPTAYLIDGDGRIVETYFGPKPREVLEKRIRELLDALPAT